MINLPFRAEYRRGEKDMDESSTLFRSDVVVVGAGYAGLAAALEASRAGADVLVLGRKNLLSSNSAVGSGGFILVDTPLQKEKGIEDSTNSLAQDILNANLSSLPEDIVRMAAAQSAELYDWLTEIGSQFVMVRKLPHHSIERAHRERGMGGARTLKLLLDAVKKRGVVIRLGTIAQRLIVDRDNGVEGLWALDKTGVLEIRADKGVILAAGGFGRNRSMMTEFVPQFSKMFCMSGMGSTGDGIRMGMEIGARPLNMDAVVLNPLGSTKRRGPLPGAIEAMVFGAILVNKNGQRFVDERLGFFSDTAFSVLSQPDGAALLVFGESIKHKIDKLEKRMDKYLSKGLFQRGRTADELSTKTGVEKESFRNVVQSYFPEGNIYGTWVKPVLTMTHGGLMVNTMAQVMNGDGHPIPRLYAAGDNTAGLGGAITDGRPFAGYIGTGYLWALASGRIAGRNAAAE
jgi:fumarate reductase flavoprotein subunit